MATWRSQNEYLSDHFELAERGVLTDPLLEERVAPGARVGGDVREGLADVFQVDAIVFHNDVASARIRC